MTEYKSIGLDLDHSYCVDCIKGMETLNENSIDLVVTSPPFILMNFMK